VPIEIQMAAFPPGTSALDNAGRLVEPDVGLRRQLHQRHEPRARAGAAQHGQPARWPVPQMGTDWSPVGQIYWYTLESTNPAFDVMEKKSLEDWTLEKSFKGVNGVVDVSSFGGPTKEYQIKLDRRSWSPTG